MDDFGSWVLARLYEFITWTYEIRTALLNVVIWFLEKGSDVLIWVLSPIVAFFDMFAKRQQ